MNVVRAFIAIDVSPAIQEQLQHVCEHLDSVLQGLPVRWIPIQNVHLTLKFLGDVSETSLAHINEALTTAGTAHKPFELSVGGLGVFPSAHRPRVIWVGVETNDECFDFCRRIEIDMERLGYAAEKREFSAHLTIGRVSRGASRQEVRAIGTALRKEKQGFLGAERVEAVHLYKSDLKPSGAVYTKLFSAPLSGA
ncbi:MAG: RNA 2',3'-cyclic phosphodiesterase [Chloroflexi bacterium]|nr:MAG: RNA 2',3'-cyclic phosphodiesterase [Chloroflexota bacterium]MBL1195928.1 RNA 2',3'-cyclic phosphodiesterase [Chloroflexota bacterium]NOH13221.1 RNA 2',3'-cyclic phosphodiesterase [Chloroflexota bacterium]